MAALYQSARPQTFEALVGQAHVKDVLVAALQRGRVGHAYLFSGPRGVGKTTTARLLAMAVNCEHPDPAARPCGVCEVCVLVRENRHPDVTELDAASNNSVEDVRDLREKVRLAAMRGGRRVWVLDEAHMLSRAASNALLKTLEEPPPGLVFILATTEPEKLPPTILSRCQHFRFRRLSEEEIAGKLERLVAEQGGEADPDALALVARAADGAMRDAESLLERLLTAGERVSRAATEDALGLPPQDRMRSLASHLAEDRLAQAFAGAAALYRDGFAPSSLASRLTETFRDALFAQISDALGFRLPLEPAELLRVIHALDDEQERFSRRDDLFSLEVALIKAANALTGNLPGRAPAEALAAPALTASPTPAAPPPALPDFDPHARPAPARTSPTPTHPPPPSALPTNTVPPNTAPPSTMSPSTVSPSTVVVSWHKVKTEAGAQLKAFLNPAEEDVQGQTIRLVYSERYKFHFTEAKKRVGELSELITRLYGSGFEVVLEGPGDSLRKKF